MSVRDAIRAGDRDEFQRSLESETGLDRLDDDGWTALGWAAGRGDVFFLDALVRRGADVFRRGRDDRTPYLVALAAGHEAAVRFLRDAEDVRGGDLEGVSSRQEERRPYCRAYAAEQLQRFARWAEPDPPLAPDDIVFVHRDGSVTRGALHGQDVVWSDEAPEWRAFCADALGFRPPTDLDLLSPS